MAIYTTTIIEEKWGKDNKRYDAEVMVKPLLGKSYTLKLRVLSQQPITADNDDLIDAVIAKRKEAKECKNSCSISLPKWNANAYIFKEKPTVTDPDESELTSEVTTAITENTLNTLS